MHLRENTPCPPLPFSAVKWQLQTEITCPPKWSWRAWFNEGKQLGISVGLNLPLIFGLDAFISQQLLYLLPHSFLPKAQWGTKGGSAGSQRCTWSELHLFHFALLCTIWSFWSVIYPEGLTALCSQLTMEELVGFRSLGVQHCQNSSASALTEKADEDICLDCLKRKMVVFMGVEIIPTGWICSQHKMTL